MATRRTAEQVDDFDDLPTEFDDEPSSSTSPAANGQSPISQGMPISNLTDMPMDDSRDEATIREITIPAGDWQKNSRWTFSKSVYSGDCLDGDIDSEGRTMFAIEGKPETRTVEGRDYQPQLRVRLSPDKRYKADKPTEVDLAHKLYLRAKDVYLALHGAKPTTFGQLIAMLEEDNYVVRTMVGDNGPVPLEIKAQSTVRRR